MDDLTRPQCPTGDFSCPYWTPSGCTLEDPARQCDDYMFFDLLESGNDEDW